MTDYTAWLIEIDEGGPTYFHFEHDDDWTRSHDKAVHFARKLDAESCIEHYGWTRAKAVQHMWVKPPEPDQLERRLGEILTGAAKRINAARQRT